MIFVKIECTFFFVYFFAYVKEGETLTVFIMLYARTIAMWTLILRDSYCNELFWDAKSLGVKSDLLPFYLVKAVTRAETLKPLFRVI